jgi:hypothetical protein
MSRARLYLAILSVAISGIIQAQPPLAAAKPLELLKRTYPHVTAKRYARAPADSAWLLYADSTEVGTLEVAFQGDEVVYMLFRRGVGGVSWKQWEINKLHDAYHENLLHEDRPGEKYDSSLLPQINAAAITRKDFDAKALISGM